MLDRDAAAPVACAIAAGLAASALLALSIRGAGWSLTALPRVDAQTALGAAARRIDPAFHTVHPGAYDGQFYWGIAVDPLALGSLHPAFDKPSYRYGHPLYGWLGWLWSGGRAGAVPAALVAAGLASLLAAAACAGALAGRRLWPGLLVALNPGLLGAFVHDLGEPLAAALLLGGFLAYDRGRPVPAWICFALLPLAKEPLVLVPLAVAAWELAHGRRRAALILTAALAPSLAWWSYARIQLGAWFTSGDTALAAPLSGWWHALQGPGDLRVAVLVGLLVLLFLGAVRALRVRGPLELAYLGLFAVAVCLAPNATTAFTTALRNTAFAAVLVPFVLARQDG